MCIKLVNYQNYTEMHGQQNIKFCDAKQAKHVHQYKNTKIKLYKSNAAIWYNKTCRIKQLVPTYGRLNLCTARPHTECDDTRCCTIQGEHKVFP